MLIEDSKYFQYPLGRCLNNMLLAQKTKMLTTRDFFILICFHLIVFVNGQGLYLIIVETNYLK